MTKFCKNLPKKAKQFDEILPKYWGLSGAKACKSCRSRQELSNANSNAYSNAYLLAKFGFDAAENEPCKVCPLSVYRSPRFSPSTSGGTSSRMRATAASTTTSPPSSCGPPKRPRPSFGDYNFNSIQCVVRAENKKETHEKHMKNNVSGLRCLRATVVRLTCRV